MYLARKLCTRGGLLSCFYLCVCSACAYESVCYCVCIPVCTVPVYGGQRSMLTVLLCLSPFSFEAGPLTRPGAMLAASKSQ